MPPHVVVVVVGVALGFVLLWLLDRFRGRRTGAPPPATSAQPLSPAPPGLSGPEGVEVDQPQVVQISDR